MEIYSKNDISKQLNIIKNKCSSSIEFALILRFILEQPDVVSIPNYKTLMLSLLSLDEHTIITISGKNIYGAPLLHKVANNAVTPVGYRNFIELSNTFSIIKLNHILDNHKYYYLKYD